MNLTSGHVSSDRLGEAAQHGGLDCLRESEQRHVRNCDRCQHLYGGYRLADRLLSAQWRDVKLPPQIAVEPSRIEFPPFLSRVDARAVAPGVAALAILALVGAAFAVPRLLPAQSSGAHSPSTSISSSSSAKVTAGPSVSASGSAGAPVTPVPGSPEPPPSASPVGSALLALTRISGEPIAWSPDGAHLLLWGAGQGRVLQIRDASGRLTGSIVADSATWVSSTTIAISTRTSSLASPVPTAQGTAARPSGGRRSGPAGASGSRPETIALVDVGGGVIATLPNGFAPWGGLPNAQLMGSGAGQFTVSGQAGSGGTGVQFALWNGSFGRVVAGMPIAFSQDGSRLAVLQPQGVSGGAVTGSPTILSVPSLSTLASFPGLVVRVGSSGPAGIDAAFSPDNRFLLVSDTLIDLSNGSAFVAGRGGWLADGTLVTASAAGLLRWSGTSSALDPRFSGPGAAEIARNGTLIYLFADERPALLLKADGTLDALGLPGVRSVSSLLISPTGRAIALDGRATNGSSITVVASLP